MTGRVLGASLALTSAVLGLALMLGGPVMFGQAATVLLLPHLLIGDTFHWRRFPRLSGTAQGRLLALAGVGFALFLAIRGAGQYGKPLFYVYFFWHFWKDLTLGLEDAFGDIAKLWTGLAACAGFAIVSSGLVMDPAILGPAKVGCVAGAALLLWSAARKPSDAAVGYRLLAAAVLAACAAIDARHPFRELIPHFIVVWHFMLWYAFMWSAPGGRTPSLAAFIVAANAASVAAALLYGFHQPGFEWLRFVFNFDYLAGCWTVMHVTWDWAPKQVRGIRLAVA